MAIGDISAVRIHSDGWYAEIDIEGFLIGGAYDFGLGVENDPTNTKIKFNVTSEGYNSSGVLGTMTRTVYGVKQLRKPYPNQLDADESESGGTLTLKVILSEFVYNDDKNGGVGTSGTDPTVNILSGFYTDNGSGGSGNGNNATTSTYAVTNNSTLDYPKVVGQWAQVGYDIVTSDFLLEAVCFHKFAKGGSQVACVKFDAADQSAHSSAQQTTTSMTLSSRDVLSEPRVIVYEATMDIDVLDDAETIDCNFIAYPWVGDADSTLDTRTTADGVTQPEERLGPLYLMNNKGGTYGRSYALIDAVSGNDTTGVVYNTQSAAEAGNAYLTIDEAVKDLKAYNNTNYTRDETGGSVCLLKEGTHQCEGDSDHGILNTWFIIRPISTAVRANTILSGDGTIKDFDCIKLKIENITCESPDTGPYYGNADQLVWIDTCLLNLTGGAGFYRWKLCFATNCEITEYDQNFGGYSTIPSPWKLMRGNINNYAGVMKATLYCIIGNVNISPLFENVGNTPGHQISDCSVFAYNLIYDVTYSPNFAGSTDISKIAIIQNLMESTQAVSAVLSIHSTTKNHSNVILFHNSFIGERNLGGYGGVSTQIHLNWSQKYNLFEDWNNKGDIFESDGTIIGNWPVQNMVGSVGNAMESAEFPPEFHGLYTACCAAVLNYVDDKSTTGDGAGNGNYHLQSGSDALNKVPIDELVLPFDIAGKTRYNNGTGAAGVYEFGTILSLFNHLYNQMR